MCCAIIIEDLMPIPTPTCMGDLKSLRNLLTMTPDTPMMATEVYSTTILSIICVMVTSVPCTGLSEPKTGLKE